MPLRPPFWNIDAAWLFYLLAGLALGVFALGAAIHLNRWRPGFAWGAWSWPRLRAALADALLGRRIWRGDAAAGLTHALILLGFLGLVLATCLVAVDHYLFAFLRGRVYLALSALWEFCGLALMAGLAWGLIRRYVQRVPRLMRSWRDALIPAWLLAVAASGFLVEAARIAATGAQWERWSFVGWGLKGLFAPATAAAAHQGLWWLHAALSLGLIAWLPFCRLFHALAAPVNLAFQDEPHALPALDPPPELAREFSHRHFMFLDACSRCGRCDDACPSARAGEPLSPRQFLQNARAYVGLKYNLLARLPWLKARLRQALVSRPTIVPEQAWYCTSCRACQEVCPVQAAPMELIRQVRSALVEQGATVPPLLGQALERLMKYANPWLAKKGQKAAWAKGLGIPDLAKGEAAPLLYFVGCTTSLDTRAQGLARSLAAVLGHCGVEFGTLGKAEPCCGDIARRVGENGLFEEQREELLALLMDIGVSEVVASSPHCYANLSQTYPQAWTRDGQPGGFPFRARHYSQLLCQMVDDGRLRFDRPLRIKATYHDPCYLARHAGVMAEPRRVLAAIPGLELVEMAEHGKNGLCCGGGGGRMWHELPGQGHLAQARLAQAAATGAEVVVTACPLCLIMLEDARKAGGFEDRLLVRDLNELAAQALGLDD
ncbi:MAG: heterodisulfide reductase-related iron-sulfur binding cluster [Thermodesulfobacteriota bacterium]